MKRERGFTLSELIAVIGLIACAGIIMSMYFDALEREETCRQTGVDCLTDIITPKPGP